LTKVFSLSCSRPSSSIGLDDGLLCPKMMGRQSVDYGKARVVTSMDNGEYSTETSDVEKKRLGVTYLRGLCHDVQVVLSPD